MWLRRPKLSTRKFSAWKKKKVNIVQLFIKELFPYLDHLHSLGVRQATD
jgi:hypothetical protein